jgi:hypothetical protein
VTDRAKVRVVPGDPWHVVVTHADGRVETAVVYDDGDLVDGVVRAYRDPTVPPETHHVEGAVYRLGYFVNNGHRELPHAMREGYELSLRPVWPHQAEQLLVEAPQRVAAAFAAFVHDVHDAIEYCLEPAGTELLTGLARRMANAQPTTVVLPIEIADEIAYELRTSPLRGIRTESADRLSDLACLIEEGRAHHSTVHEVLAQALQDTLARPGAEGLAARDALLATLTHFAALHRHATNPDDPEQQRLS